MIAAPAILIKTSVILVCVGLLSFAFRRASASVRHALWALGLLAVLVFPIVSNFLPRWDLPLLPEKTSLTFGFDTTPGAIPAPDVAPAREGVAASPLVPMPKTQAVSPRISSAHPPFAYSWNWSEAFALIWGLGSSVFLFGWVKSFWELHGLTQQSAMVGDSALKQCLSQTQREIRVTESVELRISKIEIPPMTWGIFHHVILLPHSAAEWSPVRQRLVMAHELAHVKRNDGVGQILAQAACSIYWFNPLVWCAVGRLHAERERACDDCVLRLGADGAEYADHLLQITRRLNSGFSQSAVSMAHPSQLKTRIVSILDSRMKRSRASRFTATALLTTIGVLTLCIAATQITAISTLALPAFGAPLGVPLWSAKPVQPEVVAQQPSPAVVEPQRAFINQYCLSCHNSSDRYGNLVFDTADTDIAHLADNRQLWEKVVRRLRTGMDPKDLSGVARPSAAVIISMIQFLEGELDRNAKTYVPPIGPHRLNRTEYQNAIRDLLDLEIDSAQLLPSDDSSSGFDNIASALDYSPRARDAYVGVAPIISRLAIQSAPSSSSHQRIFVCDPAVERYNVSPACTQNIVRILVENAYRGFSNRADVDDAMTAYTAGWKAGGVNAALEAGLAQILANPKFIYRTETAPVDVKSGEAFRISDLALASRLSFFLWSSSPDPELIDVAKQGKLHDPAVLEQQTLRMLKDYRAEALSTNFAGQWLGFRSLQRVTPSPAFFPDFDESLRQAMRREGELFFDSIVREDRNVVDLLTADYTFVNNRLAHLYGIPNVSGSQFRRVSLTDAFDARRGILGKAAFLTVVNNSNYNNRTSPVSRGKWLMNMLLGVNPPDPPPDVPPLRTRSSDPNVVEPSVRATMEDHNALSGNPRNNACVTCHKLVDPIGNSLENFNAIGMWRTVDGGATINAADTLQDGTTVNGPVDLRRWLVGRSDQFVQTMTQKLMTYALGRGVEFQDMPLIRSIDREAARNNYRFSSIVLGIVKSDTFQMNSRN